jgi:large subunit ribosomal protein L23
MSYELKPYLTEKSFILNQAAIYVFSSKEKMTKPFVKELIHKKYNVDVKKISSVNLKGKKKISRGRRYKTVAVYKYYLTLASGHAIEGFYE